MHQIDDVGGRRTASGGGVTLRLFAAMHVSADPARRMVEHVEQALTQLGPAEVLESDSLHLTWAFLGDVTEEVVPAVVAAFEASVADVPGPTACTPTGAETFSGDRVLGLSVDVELLTLLDAARDRFLQTVAPYAPQLDERAWRPHVSVLRTHGQRRLPVHAAASVLPLPAGISWIAPDLRLYASLPAPAGRIHRVLHAVPFGEVVPARQG